MSNNVASASTSTSALSASLPTVEEINGWKRDRVKEFLQEKKESLDLDDGEIDKIYNQKVKGNTFLELTRDDLLSIGITLGPAKEIGKLISQIQEGKKLHFFVFSVIFVNITERLHNLVHFFPAFYHHPPKKHIHVIVDQPAGKWVIIN